MSQTIDDLAHIVPPNLNDVKVGLLNICRAAAIGKGCGDDYKRLPATFDLSPASFRPIVNVDSHPQGINTWKRSYTTYCDLSILILC